MEFKKAAKTQSRARVALIGPSGSGKTYTALAIASNLGEKPRIALIDTERGSASKYADIFDFDVLELEDFSPVTYVEAINAAARAGYDVLIIDSLSHAWSGAGGALEMVNEVAKRSKSSNNFAAWREVTPVHNRMVDAILRADCHIIATMRSKTEYVQEKDERGKTVIRKVGMQAIQRDGLEYEFDVVADLDFDHNMVVSKTRCPKLNKMVENCAGERVAGILHDWLTSGAPEPEAKEKERLIRLIGDGFRELNAKGYQPKWASRQYLSILAHHRWRSFLRRQDC